MTIGWMLLSLQGLAILYSFSAGVRADDDVSPYVYSEEYDNGKLGNYPHHEYKSSPYTSPVLNYVEYSPLCDDGQYIMIAPRGAEVHHQGPMIMDGQGDLVWFHDYGHTYGLNVYQYKGEKHLTFWSGNDAITGHGDGTYYLLDSSYREAYTFGAGRGLPADLHEFHITRDETAVFTIYDVIQADISAAGGPEDGWIWDGTFQEVDIETGKVLFQWRASEHFDFSEVNRGREGNGDTEDRPWDFFHINSIDKDPKGNFLVSSRYMGSLTYIDGTNGDVIWKIGGKDNRFTDLSDGGATNMTWQHHARFHDNGKAITLFDNQSRGSGAPELQSRGLYLDVDDVNMTVSVRQSFWNQHGISSQSQGSMQIIDDERVFVGYGYNPAFTEFSMDGEILCDVHFGPETRFRSGDIMSYRVFKHEWTGTPSTVPDAVIESNVTYVSWNGATEVATWVIQGAESEDAGNEDFDFLAAVVKAGFETGIQLPYDTHPFIRVAAVNADGVTLAYSEVLETGFSSREGDGPLDEDLDDHPEGSAGSPDHTTATEASAEESSETTIVEPTRGRTNFQQPLFFTIGFVTALIVGSLLSCIVVYVPCIRSRGRAAVTAVRNGNHWLAPAEIGGRDEEEKLAEADFSDQSLLSDNGSEFSGRGRFSDEMSERPPSPATRRYNGET